MRITPILLLGVVGLDDLALVLIQWMCVQLILSVMWWPFAVPICWYSIGRTSTFLVDVSVGRQSSTRTIAFGELVGAVTDATIRVSLAISRWRPNVPLPIRQCALYMVTVVLHWMGRSGRMRASNYQSV